MSAELPPAEQEPQRSGSFNSLRMRLLLASVWAVMAAVLVLLALMVLREPKQHDVITMAPYINVRDYGAVGDGVTDDTAALQKAISANVGQPAMQTLYFPAGTYVVSDTLEWRDKRGNWQPYLTLQGESRDATKIQLVDRAGGFDDPGSPKAVIATGSGLYAEKSRGGGKDYRRLGEGNEAFRNFLYDLTIDTGRGNSGSIGIDFLGNNLAAIRNVLVRSGDGDGVAGISMTRQWVGPALLKHVEVSGFNYGLEAGRAEYGITFEDVEISGQKLAGVRNSGNVLSIRDLTSSNSVPAVINDADTGLVALIDSDLHDGDKGTSAVLNTAGHVYLRNVTSSGYASVLKDGSRVIDSSRIEKYTSIGDIPTGTGVALLQSKDTPEPAIDPVPSWVSVARFGARAYDSDGGVDYGDDSEAVQEAIDSGATTLYFPPGRYRFSDTVIIRGNVQRIEFRGSIIAATDVNDFADGRPLLEFADGRATTVVLNQIGEVDGSSMPEGKEPFLQHTSSRTLVVLDSALSGYEAEKGAGPLYLENVCCGYFRFNGQQVWARQLNVEVDTTPMIASSASDLWVLGLKTERSSTVLETKDGGITEVLGGLLYPAGAIDAAMPAFTSENSRVTLVYATSAYDPAANYALQSLTGSSKRLVSSDLLRRGLYGSFVFQPSQ